MAEITVTDLEKLKEEVSKAEQAYKDAKHQLAEQKAQDTNITVAQFDASTEAIINTLNTLNEQISIAKTKGSLKGKSIVDGFGGENKFSDFVTDLAGVIGSTVATGGTLGAMPMVVMAGAVRGVYKKVID